MSELIGLPAWIPRSGQREGKAAVRLFDSVIFSVIEQRQKSNDRHDDLLDLLEMLIEFRDEQGDEMDFALLRDEGASTYLAGHETTAMTMTWAFYLLHEHQEV